MLEILVALYLFIEQTGYEHMILIFSEKSDISTSKVIEWLISFNTPFIRINLEDSHEVQLKLTDDASTDLVICFREDTIRLSDIKYVWYRRGYFRNLSRDYFSDFNVEEQLKHLFLHHLRSEIGGFYDLFYFLTRDKCLNHPKDYFLNKLIVLSVAKEVGLKVPEFITCIRKTDVQNFKFKYGKVITKTIQDNLVIKHIGYESSHHVFKVEASHIDKLPDTFPMSFFQREIEKKYEVRVFYLDGSFYSVAHFNQIENNTSVDGKHIQQINGKLNRLTVFDLDVETKEKITKLMKRINVNSGSIDFIVSKDLEFYFLEVNSVGQFDFVSMSGNFYLEKEIGNYLTQKCHESN